MALWVLVNIVRVMTSNLFNNVLPAKPNLTCCQLDAYVETFYFDTISGISIQNIHSKNGLQNAAIA